MNFANWLGIVALVGVIQPGRRVPRVRRKLHLVVPDWCAAIFAVGEVLPRCVRTEPVGDERVDIRFDI